MNELPDLWDEEKSPQCYNDCVIRNAKHMAWWIELHCDVHAPWPDGGKTHMNNHCFSDNGDSPGILVADNASAVAIAGLRKRGRENGWKKHQGGWACPRCALTI